MPGESWTHWENSEVLPKGSVAVAVRKGPERREVETAAKIEALPPASVSLCERSACGPPLAGGVAAGWRKLDGELGVLDAFNGR